MRARVCVCVCACVLMWNSDMMIRGEPVSRMFPHTRLSLRSTDFIHVVFLQRSVAVSVCVFWFCVCVLVLCLCSASVSVFRFSDGLYVGIMEINITLKL